MTQPSAFHPEVDTRVDSTREGVNLLAELVLSESLYGQFLRSQLANGTSKDNPAVTSMLANTDERRPSREQWAEGFQDALKKRALRDFLKASMAAGYRSLWATTAESAGKQYEYIDAAGFRAARAKLIGQHAMRWWVALAGVCLVRAAQANAGIQFRDDEWTDFTFATFTLDEGLRLAEGARIASGLTDCCKILTQPFAQLIGERLPHGLSEILTNAPETTFVRELTA